MIMSDRSDNFFGGFILGAIAGSVVGALIASKLNESANPKDLKNLELEDDDAIDDEHNLLDEEPIDRTKRGLEQKIAQLNAAIDAVSNELSISTGNGRKKSLVNSSTEPDSKDEKL
jgi:gas vesicle protein